MPPKFFVLLGGTGTVLCLVHLFSCLELRFNWVMAIATFLGGLVFLREQKVSFEEFVVCALLLTVLSFFAWF